MSRFPLPGSRLAPRLRRALLALSLVVAGGAPLPAQGIPLRIQPRAGDVIRLRLDQRVEIRRARGGDAPGAIPITALLTVLTTAVIEGSDDGGTLLVATTDSAALTSNDALLARGAEALRRSVGRRVRLRVTGEGIASVVGSEGTHPDVVSFFARMPATLPRDEVTVGARWTRAMKVPMATGTGPMPAGTLTTTFRLDSLVRDGELAWVSLQGVLDRVRTFRADLDGAVMELAGEMVGYFVLDRRRGWITDARVEFDMRSRLTPPAGARVRPAHMRMKVTQRLRAF